jgi:HAE1 family hydrophobic/amphiphilic exporter-1
MEKLNTVENKKQETPSLARAGILPKFALKRPITVLTGLLALFVVGYIAFTQIAVDLFPAGFTAPYLGVWIPYSNSNPQEVEEQIAKPVEDQLQTVSGIRDINTYSSSNGCWTFMSFVQDADMDIAYAAVRDRMDRVKNEIPDDVERIYVRKWSDDDDPVIWMALIQKESYEDPYFIVEQHIKKRIERIDGVANVEIWGTEEKEVQILINQDRVRSYKVNLYEVIQQLRNDNFTVSSGYVTEGNRKIFVRSLGKFHTLEEIRNLPLRGVNLRLGDIADVVYDVPERRWRQFINGNKAVTIGIFKESMANTVELTDEILTEFETTIKKDPVLSGFEFDILFNQGSFIKESIHNLQDAALWGAFFALAVLYFFLRRLRMTLIVILAIPLSILITITVLYFIGWTLNLITMMGLMVSVGMVVDNSIVVLENIYTKRAEGKKGRDASLWGTSEVALAITMATFTTIVVFLPLILMNDEVGFKFYMLRIGLPVMVSLVASLIVAMIFIPLAATKIVSKRQVKEQWAIVKANQLYQRLLSWTMKHRMETFAILLILFISMQFAASKTSTTDREGHINDVRIIFDLPENLTVEQVAKIVKAVEDTVRAKEAIYRIKTIDARYSHNWARMRIFLIKEERTQWYEELYKNITLVLGITSEKYMPRDEVVEDIKKRLPVFPGVEFRTSWHEEGGRDGSIQLSLYGDDTETLHKLSLEVKRRLSAINDIISIETDREKGSDEIQIHIKRDQAKKYGISPQVIAGTVQYALRGIPLPKYQTEEKEIDVRIQLQEEDRQNLSQLKNITFFTSRGKEIPLDAVAYFTINKGFGEIQRENGKTHLRVKAFTAKEKMDEIYKKVELAMAGFKLPYGYSWSKGERYDKMQESNESMMQAMVLSITFVFLLMGILFESFVLPLAIIISIPFSFFGAYWIMYITGTPIDLMSRIGFVILVGIVVNNAIVLIDLVNRLRLAGYSRFDAIMEAGKHRFRPILMTAFTTIGGLIPMAVGKAEMIGMSYAPMGRTIIGGLLTSTIISLIAVPWAYIIFDDLRTYFKKVTALLLSRRNVTGEESHLVSNYNRSG